MQSDIDAPLTNFGEEAPPRDFVTVMRALRLFTGQRELAGATHAVEGEGPASTPE